MADIGTPVRRYTAVPLKQPIRETGPAIPTRQPTQPTSPPCSPATPAPSVEPQPTTPERVE